MNKVFRRPFVTKSDKEKGRECLMLAEMYFKEAEKERAMHGAVNGRITSSYLIYMHNFSVYMDKAADFMGFRNAADMLKYKNIQINF